MTENGHYDSALILLPSLGRRSSDSVGRLVGLSLAYVVKLARPPLQDLPSHKRPVKISCTDRGAYRVPAIKPCLIASSRNLFHRPIVIFRMSYTGLLISIGLQVY